MEDQTSPLEEYVQGLQGSGMLVIDMALDQDYEGDLDDQVSPHGLVFTLGRPEEGSCMVISGAISSDNEQVSLTVKAFVRGEPVDTDVLSLGGDTMLSAPLE